MNIKYIFSDIDGTLIGSDLVLSQANIDAIKRANNKGIKFVVQSGRLVCTASQYVEELGLMGKEDEYMICGNGSLIVNTKNEILYENNMRPENIETLMDYFLSVESCGFTVVSKDQSYSLKEWKDNKYRGKKRDILPATKEEIMELTKTRKFYKMLVQDSHPEVLKIMSLNIPILTNGLVCGTNGTNTNLEVVNSNVSKGQAISILCNKLGIKESEVLAIGDNYNDESMADIGCIFACPKNAVEEIKRKSDYISPYECTQGAVADIINHFVE